MGVLDIIYNMVNKSKPKKKSTPRKKRKKKQPNTNNSKTQQEVKQKIEEKIIVQDLSNTDKLLKAWNQSVKNVSDHPLSQFKVINTQVLEQLSTILSSMNQKLDKLNQLELLNEILELLKESRTEIIVSGGNPSKIDAAISKIEGLTIKDEEVINVLNDKGPQTADDLGRLIGVSRSTASSRLNRLDKMKIVRKKADGKLIYYSLNAKNTKK